MVKENHHQMNKLLIPAPQSVMTTKLPTLPVVAGRILDALRKEEFSSRELAELIAIDPALTIRILSLANSPFYSAQGKIDSIQRAIDVLGLNSVKNLALSFSIVDSMKGDGNIGFNYNEFWQESIMRAVAATAAGRLLNICAEEVFIIGLLADIGKVLISLVRPNDYLEVMREVRAAGFKDYESERRKYSYSHEDVGSNALRIWGIPEVIYMPISVHHNDIDDSGKYANFIRLIHIGDMVSEIYFHSPHGGAMERLCKLMNEKWGIKQDEVLLFVDDAAKMGSDILASFDIPSEQLRPYSQLLQEANDEMFRLNMTYDQLLRRYAGEKEKAERLADELKEANRMLQTLAVTDGLTGLHNFRYFHVELQKEMARARRHMHSVSLVMLDIDNFKQINDNYGHLSGDIVLKSLAGLIRESIRVVDTTARYGGEEFSLILPETDMKGATFVAEKLRKSIEANSVVINSIKIRVTVSMGICVYEPMKKELSEDEIIKAADRALYNSKRAGKNRLSIATL